MSTCPGCGGPVGLGGARGPIPTYCGDRCRMRVSRARRRLPVELTAGRRWVRADGKRPIRLDGSPASSTDPRTWSSYPEAKASTVGTGLGVMLGSGLGCWDLDHCLDGGHLAADAARVLASIDSPLWVERSMSGSGLHVFVSAAEGPGRRRGGVEFYSRARFIVVTGDRFIV